MGKRSNFERRPRDHYDTPYDAVIPLVPHLPASFTFIEPCAGNSELTHHLITFGGDCLIEYDIQPRHNGILSLDARRMERRHVGQDADFIITNPPWIRTKKSGYLLHKLIERFANLRPTWLLIDSDWHETKQSTELLYAYCEKIVTVGRVKWIPDSQHTGKDNCSWYLFDRDKSFDSEIEFVPRMK